MRRAALTTLASATCGPWPCRISGFLNPLDGHKCRLAACSPAQPGRRERLWILRGEGGQVGHGERSRLPILTIRPDHIGRTLSSTERARRYGSAYTCLADAHSETDGRRRSRPQRKKVEEGHHAAAAADWRLSGDLDWKLPGQYRSVGNPKPY